HLVATFSTVIPVILFFAYLDYVKKGSFGKRAAGLKVTYAKRQFSASLVRNIVKFLPWQLGHTGVIHGMYTDFSLTAILVTNSANVLAILLLGMALYRKDKRHLGDLLAGTKVEPAS